MYAKKLRGQIDLGFADLSGPYGKALQAPLTVLFHEVFNAADAVEVVLPGVDESPDDGFFGLSPKEKLTIYVNVPIIGDDQVFLYSASIPEIVDEMLHGFDFSESGEAGMDAFIARLRTFADELEVKKAAWKSTNEWPR